MKLVAILSTLVARGRARGLWGRRLDERLSHDLLRP